jgi:hypothetical protein
MAVVSYRTIVFFAMDHADPCLYPTRSLPAKFWHQCMKWSIVWVSTNPCMTEETWPGRGLNQGLQDTVLPTPRAHTHLKTFVTSSANKVGLCKFRNRVLFYKLPLFLTNILR